MALTRTAAVVVAVLVRVLGVILLGWLLGLYRNMLIPPAF
jgi:hypothetical protein